MTRKRKRPARPGADLAWRGGQQPKYTERLERSIAFWLIGDFRLPHRWFAQPWPISGQSAPLVCIADMNEPRRKARACLFVWHPSGFMRAIGTTYQAMAHCVASDVAELIPGSIVLDGRDAW